MSKHDMIRLLSVILCLFLVGGGLISCADDHLKPANEVT